MSKTKMQPLNKEIQPATKTENESLSAASCLLPSAYCTIAGIDINNLSQDEAIENIGRLIAKNEPHYMVVVNAAKVVTATRDSELKRIISNADLVTADGMSVVWASRLFGRPLKERVTGIDLFARLIATAAAKNLRVYFLGARDEAVKKVVEMLKTQHPTLQVAGSHHGYFTDSENPAIVEDIKSSRADLLFVAMGSPKQEKWIAANVEKTGARFALGVGGSFDHLSGAVRRAPLWMQNAGLEWLHRLMSEPRRMWRRYLIGNSQFIWVVVKQFFSRKSRA
ncbi:MAG: WecB/TagA/CpsF family glycosyltransferase [Acidobacteriota bacterium]